MIAGGLGSELERRMTATAAADPPAASTTARMHSSQCREECAGFERLSTAEAEMTLALAIPAAVTVAAAQ